ncbi:MAG: TolC family protein [Vicinamibacterales bacterium]|jgi:outer membrane protein TolC|nr:hypothetical protein [Acidobacteriota bacterium]MDP6372375.1 TolC family protein [Vicinamibacterales bacterium]MDP6608578.1 TolC family protein [Vicinamibacterales bacterium]HAK54354.1 hypothetical protein [Acidobacteriota bacterium]|tara:strand:+ start:2848 stop:4584 length:1737 start_codon:yes stop_codon:yes gene_type:complete
MIGKVIRGCRVVAIVAASCVWVVPASGQALSDSGRRSILARAAATEGLRLPSGFQAAAASRPLRRLTMDEAVELALEQNLNIQVERLNPQIQDLAIADVRSAWTPSLDTSIQNNTQDSPATNQLAGGLEKITTETFSNNVGISQLLPWGASYQTNWNSSRQTTTNFFSSFDPALRSNFQAVYVQPLLRNFRIDNTRQRLRVSRTNRDISDIQLRDTIVSTVRNVKNAYWELSYAISALAVQQQSLELAEESLRNNRTRVEVGTMAPIDIVEAEAEVARNEETVIVAEAAIDEAEDALRALIMDPSTPNFWALRLEPTDTPLLQTREIDIDAAVGNALGGRTDLAQIRRSLDNTDTNIEFYSNQRLPDVNLQVNYLATGAGGSRLIRDQAFGGNVIDTVDVGFGSVLGDVFGSDFPTWTLSLNISYPIGTSSADANLARSRLERSQTQARIRSTELQAATEVRRVGREVNTNLKRVDATRAARQLAEERLEAEQKKFAVGMSTSFLVFQAQRDLAQARNSELRAILDYNRSQVDFEAVQETSLSGGGGSFTLATGAGNVGGQAVGGGAVVGAGGGGGGF